MDKNHRYTQESQMKIFGVRASKLYLLMIAAVGYHSSNKVHEIVGIKRSSVYLFYSFNVTITGNW